MGEHPAPTRGPVGRERELALLGDLLGDVPDAPAVFVHGPGGVGKSALVSEVRRRARSAGLTVLSVDGRDPMGAQGDAREATAAALAADRALVVLDGYEHVAALGALLRRELAPAVGVRVRLLVAGRRPPEPDWWRDGWDGVLRVLALSPLRAADARALLARRGVHDPQVVEEVVRWAGGSPLVLGAATDALLAGDPLDVRRLDTDAALAQTLMRRLAGDELDGADQEVLATAAIARAVDARLLAAVLPGVDADHAEEWLRGRSFAAPLGTRVALHERVRGAARVALRAGDPVHERELRRRVADHVADRIALGDLWMLADLTELIDDPSVRWGMSPSHAVTHRYGPPEPGDAEIVAASLGVAQTAWWAGVRRWFDESPQHVVVVRDAHDAIAYIAIGVTPDRAPDWAGEDAVAGPWLEHARAHVPSGAALVVREALDLSGEPGVASAAAALGNVALVVGSDLVRSERMYCPASGDQPSLADFRRAVGRTDVPVLDVTDHERVVRCQVHDFGPGGLPGWVLGLVYRDLGLPPPPIRRPATIGAESVRTALRSFHDPAALAASPLARGTTAQARAESVRRRLREAVDGAFGDSDDERLLRTIVARAYLDPDGGHARSEYDLHISRATYFRRLRSAVARVCERVLATSGG